MKRLGKFKSAELVAGKITPGYIKLGFELNEPIIESNIIFDYIVTEDKFIQYGLPFDVYDSDTCQEKIAKIFEGYTFDLEIYFDYFNNAFHPKITRIVKIKE